MSNVFLGWVDRAMRLGLEVVLGRYYGMYDGICVDNADPEARGRILVRVPALGRSDDSPISTWACPAFGSGCGRGYGEFMPPEVGDHVMVSFDFGDSAKPVYHGGCYVSGGVPAEFVPEKGKAPKKRGWKSAVGHFLRFDDTAGNESVTLSSSRKSFVNLDDGVFIASNGGTSVFQMRDGAIVLIDEAGNVLSSSGSGWTIQNGAGFIQLNGDTIQIVAKNIAVTGSASIGAPQANSPVVRFIEFASLFATHTHPTVYGPSGPPIQAAAVSSCQSKSVMVN